VYLVWAGVSQKPAVHQFRMRPFKHFGDEPKTHPLPRPRDFSAPFCAPKFFPPSYFHPDPPALLPTFPLPTRSPHFPLIPSQELGTSPKLE